MQSFRLFHISFLNQHSRSSTRPKIVSRCETSFFEDENTFQMTLGHFGFKSFVCMEHATGYFAEFGVNEIDWRVINAN